MPVNGTGNTGLSENIPMHVQQGYETSTDIPAPNNSRISSTQPEEYTDTIEQSHTLPKVSMGIDNYKLSNATPTEVSLQGAQSTHSDSLYDLADTSSIQSNSTNNEPEYEKISQDYCKTSL